MSDSMVYTIGTALSRAKDQGLMVQVLVEGQWLGGVVSASDGHGLVLRTDADEQAVIRMESISAVRVLSAAAEPARSARPTTTAYQTHPDLDADLDLDTDFAAASAYDQDHPTYAHPMPAPRPAPTVPGTTLAISR